MTGWISAKKELPEEYTDVIVTDGEQVWSDFYAMKEWNTEPEAVVTHWMPMPEPPRGVQHV